MKKCGNLVCDFITNDQTCGDYENERQCPSPNSYVNTKREEGEQNSAKNMTLRDYFAAAVIPFFADIYRRKDIDCWMGDAAERAYRLADVMLRAREEGGGK